MMMKLTPREKDLLNRISDNRELSKLFDNYQFDDLYFAVIETLTGGASSNYCTVLSSILLKLNINPLAYMTSASKWMFNSVNFKECGYTSLVIPSNIKSIQRAAFSYSSGLQTLKMGESIEKIDKDAFFNASIDKFEYTGTLKEWCGILMSDIDSNPLGVAVDSVIAGQSVKDTFNITGVTDIEMNVFANTNIETLNINEQARTIAVDAFAYNELLKTVNLSEGLYSIGGYAFESCSDLRYINIPESVGYIGANAFAGCTQAVVTCNVPYAKPAWDKDCFRTVARVDYVR